VKIGATQTSSNQKAFLKNASQKKSPTQVLKILMVLLACILTYMSKQYAGNYYYLAYSISYATIAATSARASILINSKLLLLYSAASLTMSIAHLAVSLAFYAELKYIIWYAPINLSISIELIECALIITGLGSVIIYITNLLNDYHDQHQDSFNSMDNIK
tara:strand:- start:174 stop:656 length:483 start_codon:yes stop_codon:yes gene_type:complete